VGFSCVLDEFTVVIAREHSDRGNLKAWNHLALLRKAGDGGLRL
jgi:hypothetical protein